MRFHWDVAQDNTEAALTSDLKGSAEHSFQSATASFSSDRDLGQCTRRVNTSAHMLRFDVERSSSKRACIAKRRG